MWNIVFLGLVSFFSDISSQMIYPIVPLYLTSVFGATPALVGLIEGIAESLASLLKVFSGYITDRYKRKKQTAFAGYSAGLLYKIALVFVNSWTGVLGARVIDRIGKGIRTTPRDVIISESSQKNHMGKAFGTHKAMDMAGSAIGIMISYILIKRANGDFIYKQIFLASAIPALFGLAMFLFIKEKKGEHSLKERETFWKNIKKLNSQLKLYLLVAFLFSLGNSSNAFLLLRAKSLGFDDASVILLYFTYHATASLLSISMGKTSDKVGRKKLLIGGYMVFSATYLGFAFAFSKVFMLGMFVLYGVYAAMVAGVERAFISEMAPIELKGTMLGMHATLVGIALLPASVIAGLLWNMFGARVPFLFGAGMSMAATATLFLFMKESRGDK